MTKPEATAKAVLIVDDEEDIRLMLREVLARAGFRVLEAADGGAALDVIARESPAAVVLDLMLPRRGGYEVLQRLQHGPHARIPVVVVTGRYTDRSTAELIRREANVVEFITKPLDPKALVNALRGAVVQADRAGDAS